MNLVSPMSGAEASSEAGSTHFVFAHKVFEIEGCHFSSTTRGEPRFKLPMGENVAAIAFPALRQEFGIVEESPDGELLKTVADGLKFVRVIRPNDAIPRELLDGSASWSVDDEHRVTAKNRLVVQLITWLSGSEEIVRDAAQLEQMAKNPDTVGQLKIAFKEMAERIGTGDGGEKEIIRRIDNLAHELAYIEGLWAYFLRIRNIAEKVDVARQLYGSDASIKEILERVALLIKPVIDDIEFRFDELEAQSEVAKVLENHDAHIKTVRQSRDELHLATQIWSELSEKWQEQTATSRSDDLERVVQETYQFLAQHFPQGQEWKLTY